MRIALSPISNLFESLEVIRSDVLLVNYTKLAELRGGPLSIVKDSEGVASRALNEKCKMQIGLEVRARSQRVQRVHKWLHLR